MDEFNDNEITLKNIGETEKLLSVVQNKYTYPYCVALGNLVRDYDKVGNSEGVMKRGKELVTLVRSGKVRVEDTKKDGEKVLQIEERWDNRLANVLKETYDAMARNGCFESYCIALEFNRPIEKQFFIPRMNILMKHGLVKAFQELFDGEIDLMVLNLPPRVGKSTLSLFFLSFMAAHYPDGSILGNGHSTSLTQSFYNELINLLTSEEYRFNEIFPHLEIAKKSSEYSYLDLNNEKRFHTIMFRSVDGGTTGLAEASTLLYCDDLVKDVETANNPDRLEKLYYSYTSTIKDRKVQRMGRDGVYRPCPELHVNTPWSIHDVTSRVIENERTKSNNDRVRIISIPCWDENGDSNFMYEYGKGFDVKYYKDMELAEDPVIFSAKYLMKPIERDGRPFEEKELSFYNNVNDSEVDNVCAYLDVSHGGEDYMSLPIAYVSNKEVYIEDVWFENNFGGDSYSVPRICDKIIEHQCTRLGVEKNNGGDFYATLLEKEFKKRNYRCHVTTHNAPTNKSKLDRILACSNEIRGVATGEDNYRLYFKSRDKQNKMYSTAMKNLYGWSQKRTMQTKQHDDMPDSLAGLIINVLGGKNSKARSIDARKWGI